MVPLVGNNVDGDGVVTGSCVPESSAEKTKSYREYIEAAATEKGLHQVVRMGEAQCKPRVRPGMEDLHDSSGERCTTEEQKHLCVRHTIWSQTSERPEPFEFPYQNPDRLQRSMILEVSEQEVKAVIMAMPNRRAAGPDEIPIQALKKSCALVVPVLTKFINICIKLRYFPKEWREAIVSMIPKLGRVSYDTAKDWRPVSLLSVPGKVFEKVLSIRLTTFATDNELIPRTQYGAPGRSTVQALHETVGIIHDAWSRKTTRNAAKGVKNAATLLGLDISGAYNCVDRRILLERLGEVGVPEWFLHLIHSFLSDRQTVLKLPESFSAPFFANIGIPQGSPLSPILFVLFTAPLLERVNQYNSVFGDKNVKVHCIAYVDDTYLIAVSDSHERNCVALKSFHDVVLEWADSVGLEFSPQKYSVMHFRKRGDHSDPDVLPDIDGLKDNPDCLKRESLRVLGVMLDPQLTFSHHITKIEASVHASLRFFRRVCGSTWGLTLQEAKKWYFSHIRPKIVYACPAWFVYDLTPPGERHITLPAPLRVDEMKQLTTLHNECLRLLSGAFRTTSRPTIQNELNIESIDVFLWRTMMTYRATSLATQTELECQDPGSVETAYRLLDKKTLSLVAEARKPFDCQQRPGNSWDACSRTVRKKAIKEVVQRQLSERTYTIWRNIVGDHVNKHMQRIPPIAMKCDKGYRSLKHYQGFTRPEATLALQLRTECIGLNWYLSTIKARRDVRIDGSDVVDRQLITPECTCGYRNQTVYHMFMRCPNLNEARAQLFEYTGREVDMDTLLTRYLKVAVNWAMVYFPLDQFVVARRKSTFYVSEEGS
ncbi:hypothetical protein FPOA_09383 [Fusarium poae]|uniref:Reverse transcriptase domain-containing protein n=1 Tax=Fusarium poae TaxID=36050 RepID=A0A1B8AAZ8_FUSPO|nr:hypothetical protein FPOA_09383 [Fusarium poae]